MPSEHIVNRCICYDVFFEKLKEVAEETGAQTIEELQEHIDFGLNCGMCVMYVAKMLETGDTEFKV